MHTQKTLTRTHAHIHMYIPAHTHTEREGESKKGKERETGGENREADERREGYIYIESYNVLYCTVLYYLHHAIKYYTIL